MRAAAAKAAAVEQFVCSFRRPFVRAAALIGWSEESPDFRRYTNQSEDQNDDTGGSDEDDDRALLLLRDEVGTCGVAIRPTDHWALVNRRKSNDLPELNKKRRAQELSEPRFCRQRITSAGSDRPADANSECVLYNANAGKRENTKRNKRVGIVADKYVGNADDGGSGHTERN